LEREGEARQAEKEVGVEDTTRTSFLERKGEVWG